MRINYSSYAHVIEKGMNKRNMTGMAQILFKFMCDHEDVVTGRITKKDLEQGITHKRYNVPDRESIEWFRGEHDVAETLKKGAGNSDIIAEAPGYFDENIIDGLINAQKLEIVINAMTELIEGDDILDDQLRERWKDLKEEKDFGTFLAEIFLYAVPQPNCIVTIDQEVVAPELDDEDSKELQMFESLVQKHAKPESKTPPLIIDPVKEMTYVKQLLKAYADAEHIPCMEMEDLQSYPVYQRNFEKQRRDFYSADTIRESSKEILKIKEKDGFDIVKQEVLDTVTPVWELSFSEGLNGYQRLLRVLNSAGNAQLSSNTKRRLLDWIAAAEKQGICHILVGEDRLWWVDDTETI